MDSNDEYVDFPELLDRLGHDPLAVLRVGTIRQDREHLLRPGLLVQPSISAFSRAGVTTSPAPSCR